MVCVVLGIVDLKSGLELFWIDQEAGNVDEIETNCEEKSLLALRLEH